MGRNKGTFEYSANLEGIIEGPIDAKQVVQFKADLILPATWEDGASAVWLYNGMMVGVGEDPVTANNGIYVLLDKTTYTNIDSWLQVNSAIQNIETSPRTVYCDPTGSDTTGDGTIGLPFRQPKRAFEDIGTVSFTEIIVHLNAGTYQWDSDTATALQARTMINGLITIEGDWSVVHTAVSWTATSPNTMLYNCTKAGLTLVADELVGLFKSESKPDPISYNGAGVAAFDIEAARPNRNGSKDIVQHASIIEVTGGFVFDLSYYNDVSSEILFKNLRVNQIDAEQMHFEFHTAAMQFQSCYLSVPSGIVIGQFSMSWNQQFLRFDRCYLGDTDYSDQRALNIRRSNIFLNFSRTVIDGTQNPYSHIGTVLADGKNMMLTFLTCIFRGAGGSAAIDGANYLIDTDEMIVFRDYDAAIRAYEGQCHWVNFSTQDPMVIWILESVDYLLEYYPRDFQLTADIQKWVGVGKMYEDGHQETLINPQDKINIQIAEYPGHWPEISRGLAQTGIPVNTTTWITVGDITINHMVEVTFSGRRSTTGFAGKEMLQVNGGVLVANTIAFQVAGVPGVTINSQLSGNSIQIGVVVDNSSANLVDFLYSVQRTLLP